MAAAAALLTTLLLLGGMQLALNDRIIAAPVILTWFLLARAGCEGPLAASAHVFAGEASFALYLVHMPVIVAFKGVVAEVRGVDSAFRITPVELTGLFVATTVIAAALHLLVEKPGRTCHAGLTPCRGGARSCGLGVRRSRPASAALAAAKRP